MINNVLVIQKKPDQTNPYYLDSDEVIMNTTEPTTQEKQ